MIQESEVKFRRLEAGYGVLYHGDLIGSITYTPLSCSPWTFTTSDCWTFGSTRLQAIRFYFDCFLQK